MKFIFDFDDVVFFTTRHRKEVMFPALERAGIPAQELEDYYRVERERGFSLWKILDHFALHLQSSKDDIFKEIMSESKNFTNLELLEVTKKLGKENCYLITFGDDKFQREKIKRAGVGDLFSEISTMLGGKKEFIETIAARHKDEEVIFVDDKAHHFEDLDLKKYPNLKTILYDELGSEKLKRAVDSLKPN